MPHLNSYFLLRVARKKSKGRTLDPDTVAHEHHSIFFPDNGHGAANAAPASAGATAAKLCIILYYIIC